uniref:PX domain-containing protein n=1 Tax=Ditylenchus dipsaci TaxID=166011 RepID=A0A915D2H1_9BILA
MIHCTIPTVQSLSDKREPYKKYNVFDIHLNGAYHCSARYSTLFNLHEKLVDTFGFRLDAPEFPPKKVWRTLDTKAINERREALAKYFQGVIQNPDVARHAILEKAFLEFQISSFAPPLSSVKLEIFLPDGRPMVIDCYSDDSTSIVMQSGPILINIKLCDVIGMNKRYMSCFGLFLAQPRNATRENGLVSNILFDQICIRWLKNFESPFISQQLANKDNTESGVFYKITIRRVTWDPSVEEPLLDDPGCLKLLFLQALNDLQRDLMRISADNKERLSTVQEEGDFKQFVRMCHLQPNYGYELLKPVISDFPQANTCCQLKVGRRQIVLEYEDNGIMVQSVLRSTRIRVWRVSQNHSNDKSSASGQTNSEMTFQIEYLAGKNEFGVITLNTDQAVILSLFLQSIAAEILRDHQCNSPTFQFDDSVSTKAIESLEISKANSIISEDLSIQENGSEAELDNLFKIISYQMPFDNESFEDVTDADL